MTAGRRRVAPDTSVIVAALASWHEQHDLARAALERDPVLIGHCALETYSVLTRLPVPHRVSADVAADLLRLSFAEEPLVLPSAEHRALLPRLAAAGVVGGAVYDALVGATAAHHGVTPVTLDQRARITYARLGISFRPIGG